MFHYISLGKEDIYMKMQRRIKILDFINEHGTIKTVDLLEKFKISKATLNRDLTDLESEGHVHKIHGGVTSNKFQLTYEPLQNEKENTQKEFKRLIAKEALNLIRNGMTIILDSGTTSLVLANEIRSWKSLGDLVAITNDLKIGMLLSENQNIKLIVLGGQRRQNLYSLIGTLTEKALESINADLFFLCVDAFDIERGVSNANFEEIAIKKQMMKSANEVILLADYTKFNKVKLAKVCEIDEVDIIITDYRITDEEKSDIKMKCENIIIARE